MTLATALLTGNDPDPQLAEAAVEQAMQQSGLAQAQGVLLFLTPEFARHAQPIVTAIARRTRCMQVAGGIASGVFTESGWALDRPAAAAMVLGGRFSLGYADKSDAPLVSWAGGTIPSVWRSHPPRLGGAFGSTFAVRPVDTNAIVWQQARLAGDTGCSVPLHGACIDIGVSRGWRTLSTPQTIEQAHGYELRRLGHTSALRNLLNVLPSAFRLEPERHLHQLVALLGDADPLKDSLIPAAIIAVNADGCVTLAERIEPGRKLTWAIRIPETAETDMRETVEKLAREQETHGVPPAGALMFSCIGRSPFFYGGEDRDLNAFTERFPGLPILGVYGTAQIAPLGNGAGTHNDQFQNSVVTALMTPQAEEADV